MLLPGAVVEAGAVVEYAILGEQCHVGKDCRMGKEVGMSSVQLYRKVKAMMGLAPKEYLRISRLKFADHLLATTKLNINEIAYKSGFSSPNYFSKCYKDYFGRTPKSNR